MTPRELPATWTTRAEELAPFAPAAAEAFRRAAIELETALRVQADEALTLDEAARESGYSAEHLRHQLAAGEIPQAGRRGAPRIRRGDLPPKPRRTPTLTAYDVDADARRLAGH